MKRMNDAIVVMLIILVVTKPVNGYGIPGSYVGIGTGSNIEYSKFEGEYLTIEFFDATDNQCALHVEELFLVWEEYQESMTIISLSINSTREEVIEFYNANRVMWVIGLSLGETEIEYNITTFPTTILFDETGETVKRFDGYAGATYMINEIGKHIPSPQTTVDDNINPIDIEMTGRLIRNILYVAATIVVIILYKVRNGN